MRVGKRKAVPEQGHGRFRPYGFLIGGSYIMQYGVLDANARNGNGDTLEDGLTFEYNEALQQSIVVEGMSLKDAKKRCIALTQERMKVVTE